MNDPKSHQEPSMEEILASIRRIISEDDVIAKEGQVSTLQDVGQVPQAEAKEEFTVDEGEGGGLELTEEIEPKPTTIKQTDKSSFDIGLNSLPSSNESTAQVSVLAPGERLGQSVGANPCTIEDLVKEMMRPMIKEWLDDNLPALVKRLVRREFGRISRRAADGIDD